MPEQRPDGLRFFLSHFPSRRTTWKQTGPKTATRSSCGDAPFVNGIRSLATDTASSRRTMNITTGSGSVAVGAPAAGRLSPSCRPTFGPLHPLQRAGSLPALRRRFEEHCSWEEAAPTLKHPDRVPDPSTLRSLAAWTPPSLRVPFYTKRPPASLIGWHAGIRPIPGPGHCLG